MYKKNKVLVIIPARSGSKGIKNKNIKIIQKKPLLAHSLFTQRDVNLLIGLWSTDSNKYANIARKFKADVPFLRSKKLSGDRVKDYPVIRNCLKISEKYYKTLFDYIILLRPTSPFREKLLIEKGLKKLHNDKFSTSIRSVIQTKKHPYRHWKIIKKRKMISIVPNVKEPYNIPRQQLPKMFFQTGDIEIVKRKTIMDGSISGTRVIPLIVKSFYDIDTIDDIKKIK